MIQQPAHLAARKIGINDQAGFALDHLLMPGPLQILAEVRGAPVLPHDGVTDWFAGAAVPQDRGLALVGDANGRQIARFDPSPGQRRAGDLKLTGPDLARVMLHPPGLGENLLKLLLCGGADGASMLKDNRPGARCPLIQRQNERHRRALQEG